MKKYTSKNYFGEIFFEFAVHEGKRDAIILLPGFPSSNIMEDIIYFFYEKGFNVFFPRYKGTFQSGGHFLKSNPTKDLSEFISFLKKGKSLNLWDEKMVSFEIDKFYVFGTSFGGSIACSLAYVSEDVSKVVVGTPVWDYESHNQEFNEQDLEKLTGFVKRSLKNIYRYDFKNLVDEMKRFKQFSFSFYKKNLKKPVLVFHDLNDNSISIEHSRKAEKEIKSVDLIETDTGHGLSIDLLNKYYPSIDKFLKD
tara:strand:+ start:1398 stop:2153 length:756 start_codon:yes stop_codon:yes gene_type:complete